MLSALAAAFALTVTVSYPLIDEKVLKSWSRVRMRCSRAQG